MAFPEQDAVLVLMHEGQYPLAGGGTANFVVGLKDCLTPAHAMNSARTNAGGWNGTELRTELNTNVYNQLPEPIRKVLKKMNVYTANGGSQAGTVGVYSEDYLALAAEKEVFNENKHADSTIESQLFQLTWYKTKANRIKQSEGNEYTKNTWFERSPGSKADSTFGIVYEDGTYGMLPGSAEDSYGISFICCI